jgi:hypothetical protein
MTATARNDVIRGLRQLAAFIEQHPNLPAPMYSSTSIWLPHGFDAEATIAVAAELAPAELSTNTPGSVDVVRLFAGAVRLTMHLPESVIVKPEPAMPTVAPGLLAAIAGRPVRDDNAAMQTLATGTTT